MKRLIDKAGDVLRNPVLRPVEIWALRALLGALATWLGLDLSHVLT